MRDRSKDPAPQAGDIVNDPGSIFHGAEIIYAYTRAQAIEDGVLVDLTDIAKTRGILIPLALTSTAFHEALNAPFITKGDELAPLFTIVRFIDWVRTACRANPTDGPEMIASFTRIDAKPVSLKIHIGPGDRGEPVFTVMLPDED